MSHRRRAEIRPRTIARIARSSLVLASVAAFAAGSASVARKADADEEGSVEPKTVYVELVTSKGSIVLALDRARAPETVDNFLRYVDEGFYDGTIFHRVIDGFMIQGGGFDENLVKKPTHPPVRNEWRNGLKNERGTIAMARIGGQPDSATAQFFINTVDNAGLDVPRDGAAYAVFGRVIRGMDVVDEIEATPVYAKDRRFQSLPRFTVKILEAKRISEREALGEAATAGEN